MPPLILLPFLIHTIIEVVAGLSFISRPQSQLQPLSPAAKLILECYGGLLIFSSCMSLLFYTRGLDAGTTRMASCAFALWHLFPAHRAVIRIRTGVDADGEIGRTLGGPWLHLMVHGGTALGFALTSLSPVST